eukprot:Phypoly_transcript_03355.p1 GENE.Phypoly_transcript_03355~~Phypoly_transcript_03355.p1  ORF type:complete len:778 (+),score=130.15 Phypoly_transcript_03355:51-2336(+)
MEEYEVPPLYKAAHTGDLAEVSRLITAGANVNELFDERTPLYTASVKGHTEVVKKLVEAGADINQNLFHGFTPIFPAIEYNHPEIFSILKENGANLNVALMDGNTPLHYAAIFGRFDMLKQLADAKSDIFCKSHHGNSVLHAALHNATCSSEMVSYLLACGLDKEEKDGGGFTSLAIAVSKLNAAAARVLLAHGANAHAIFPREKVPKKDKSILNAVCFTNVDLAKVFLEFKDEINMEKDIEFALSIICNNLDEAKEKLIDMVKRMVEKEEVKPDGKVNEKPFILFAVQYKRTETVEFLLKNGAPANFMYAGVNVGSFAVAEDSVDVVRLLAQYKCDFTAVDEDGKTAAHAVSSAGAVHALSELGTDLEMPDENGATPLHCASVDQNAETIEALLSKVKNVSPIMKTKETPLDIAASRSNWEAVEVLIKHKAKCGPKLIAFHRIYEEDKADVLRMMFQHGTVTKDVLYDTQWSLLHIAARTKALECCKVLVNELKYDINNCVPSSPLHMACKADSKKTSKFLVESGANVNIRRDDGISPIYLAVIGNNVELAEYLLDHGAATNILHAEGHSILHSACLEANLDMVKLLLNRGSDVHATNHKGDTPLLSLCQAGDSQCEDPQHLEVAKLLIERGASVTHTQKNGSTGVMLAAEIGLEDVVEELIEHGCDPAATSVLCSDFPGGVTALQLAAQNGHLDVIKLLIDKGVDVNAQDTRGVSALSTAIKNGHKEIIKYLKEKGATQPQIAFTGRKFVVANRTKRRR